MSPDVNPLAGKSDAMPATNPFAGILRFLQVVRLRKGIVISSLLISGLLGVLYYFTATRLYESVAEVLVLQTGNAVLDNTQVDAGIERLMPTYRSLFTTDVVLQRALSELPEVHRIDLLKTPPVNRVKQLRSNLDVRSDRKTNLIRIRYRSKAPETAAAVVDSILTSYRAFMDETHKSVAHDLLDVLTTKMTKQERDLHEKERELLALREASEAFYSDGDKTRSPAVERVNRLNQALSDAQQQTADADAFLVAVEEAVRNGEDIQHYVQQMIEGVDREFLLAELGLGRDNRMKTGIEQQLLGDGAELDSMLDRYGPNHPDVLELHKRIQSNRNWLAKQQENLTATLNQVRRSELEPRLIQMARQKRLHAMARERSLHARLEQEQALALSKNKQMAKIATVEHELDRFRKSYDALLDGIRDIDLGQDFGLITSVVGSPQVPTGHCWPRLSVVAILCLVFGIGGGIAIIYVMDTLDDRFRSPEEMRVQLGVPVLSMVRQMPTIEGHGIDCIHTLSKPNGIESEAFRTLRTSISFAKQSTGRLVVTSTEPGDGKTTVLVNLAVAFAQSGKRTLLIDADMRRPGMTALLDLRGSQGLSQVLRDDRPLAESAADNLYSTELEGMHVMPSGPRPINPAELLASDRFSELLAWAETLYDQILIDAPPALAVSDPTIIGRLVDGLLLVVRPDKNRRKMVIRTAEMFASVDINVLGVVLNHLTAERGSSGYYGYGYGYGYGNGYGYGYGHSEDDGDLHQTGDANEPPDVDDSPDHHADEELNSRRAA